MTLSAFILAWWIAHGAQPHQAHALLRQATIESGPSANPGKTGLGHCLYQWTGARWQQLRQWARSRDCPGIDAQLSFALTELRDPTYSCFWQAAPTASFPVLRRTFGAGARCGGRGNE